MRALSALKSSLDRRKGISVCSVRVRATISWRNWRPFLAYSIGLLGVAMAAMTVISVIGLLSPLLAVVPAMAFPVIFVPVVFASTYTNAIDVFERIGPDEAD